jgi:cytochrome c-type biogenesis protein CcmH
MSVGRARPRLLAATLLAAMLAAGALMAPGARAAGRPHLALTAIEREYMCVTCKIPLNVAQSTQADRERAFIGELIDDGDDRTQIREALVAQYGPAVLGLPQAHGFDLTVYVVPAAVVAALAAVVALLLPRWRRRARAQSAALAASAAPLHDADRARLDADMARFD